MSRMILAFAAVLVATNAIAIPITNNFYGSVSRLIVNNCSAIADDQGCAGNQLPREVLIRDNQSVLRGDNTGNAYRTGFGTVTGDVTFTGGFDAPVVRALADSNSTNIYTQSFIGAYQTYTYQGATAQTVDIGGTLSFDFSGTTFGTVDNDTRPGDGGLFLSVTISTLEGADYQLIGDFLQVNVGSTILGTESYLTLGPAGPGSFDNVDVFSTVTIQPGQSFLISVQLQVVGDRRGFTDADSTFVTGFAGDTPEAFLNQLVSGTQVAVPEPATLGLLMLGMAGVVLLRPRK